MVHSSSPLPCIPSQNLNNLSLKSTPKWPERLDAASIRVSIVPGGNANTFKHDNGKWKVRIKHYKSVLPALGTDKIRNVMDMNTLYGGFAAALIKSPLWVMNVVSSYGPHSLGAVYDRGLIGSYHDWCEAFSTYPRTYDLLHLDGLFTDESHRCEMKYVLLEMDRILRPNGYVIIRESYYFVDAIATIAKGMRWVARSTILSTTSRRRSCWCARRNSGILSSTSNEDELAEKKKNLNYTGAMHSEGTFGNVNSRDPDPSSYIYYRTLANCNFFYECKMRKVFSGFGGIIFH
ncbi:putative methyltransferase PMT21 [Iris pallida]|uniref:Methyltransferase n=1 Tax=Iris pallida TaxID=29817 RepID=A0AAX6H089_IRIPA|nr:putative methyltransferase PMT21 [Iris pallida]